MSDDKTTIRIPDEDFAEAKRKKEAAGQTWAEYCTDDARGTPDAEALADALAEEMGETEALYGVGDDEPAEIRKRITTESLGELLGEDEVAIIGQQETLVDNLADRLEAATDGDWDDMKNACAAAIREELTVTEMGGQR